MKCENFTLFRAPRTSDIRHFLIRVGYQAENYFNFWICLKISYSAGIEIASPRLSRLDRLLIDNEYLAHENLDLVSIYQRVIENVTPKNIYPNITNSSRIKCCNRLSGKYIMLNNLSTYKLIRNHIWCLYCLCSAYLFIYVSLRFKLCKFYATGTEN